MRRSLRIISYFSLPTDLASEMRDWSEFQRGIDYDVELMSLDKTETVSVRFAEEDESKFVRVSGMGDGPLFDRVVGRVLYALSAHSDTLIVERDAKTA